MLHAFKPVKYAEIALLRIYDLLCLQFYKLGLRFMNKYRYFYDDYKCLRFEAEK